ncbi:urease accessory protein UreD [Kitasatospora sp. DSM 101779]|uniref:urease accessory protein UreD n=1 Tax=Kitasatospora sp. DSM 101779 TaxID=2853165 RepID=UPI0021D9097E|nr:urease accessory protein UreD [Kitasatospora sp. DSM 101779]
MTTTAPHPAAVDATARITAAPDGRGGTALPVLAGAGPLALRRTRGAPGTAHVCVIGSMAAPLGGDRLALHADVRPGAALTVTSAAATVSLPGRTAAPARYDLHLTVGEDAELDWRPEPVIAATGSHLLLTTVVHLAPGARLRLREEQVLGRLHDHARGAPPGRITARLTVHLADRTPTGRTPTGRILLDQQTDLGPGAPGWDGPAVLGPHRTTGQLLTVGLPAPPPPPAGTDAALLTLPGPADGPPATLLTALAPDALALRRLLASDGGRNGPARSVTSGAPRTSGR